MSAGQLLATKGFVAGSDGNISARRGADEMLITVSGANKGMLTPSDLVEVDLSGNIRSGAGRPSSEMAMHLFAYRSRGDVGACVHSHPPFATALALAGIPLPPDILPEVVLFVG
ncbi:MAG: class II aldolase/adducin family protein, partial [Candidatus Zixiibacteriota bacterium]